MLKVNKKTSSAVGRGRPCLDLPKLSAFLDSLFNIIGSHQIKIVHAEAKMHLVSRKELYRYMDW
jgi:hypothetical protein